MLIFASVQLLPGNVATAVLGRNATPQAVHSIEQNLGLNRSLVERYATFLSDLVRGRLGDSTVAIAQGTRVTVWSTIRTPIRNSLVLAGLTVLLFVPLALLLGAWAAVRQGKRADHAINTSALTIGAMPEFLVGTLLVLVFFTSLHLLPPISETQPGKSLFSDPRIFVLPVVTLLSVSLAYTTRLVRATTIEVLRENYVSMARLNGYRERRVIWRYALRNALAPAVQGIAQTVQYLIGGIIIVESVFNYPGIGTQLVQSVSARDVQMIAVIAVMLAAIYIAVNILADLAVMLLVPKLRYPTS